MPGGGPGARVPSRPWNLGLASVGNRLRGDEALLPKDKFLRGRDCDVCLGSGWRWSGKRGGSGRAKPRRIRGSVYRAGD